MTQQTIQHAIILADEHSTDIDAVLTNCRRLVSAFNTAGLKVTIVSGFEAELVEESFNTSEVSVVRNAAWETAGKAEALRVGLAATDDQRTLVCNADATMEQSMLDDLIEDDRANLLAVSLQLPSQMHTDGLKFQLEPIDVPWYSRRVMRLSRTLDHRMCHGRPIGFAVIGTETIPNLRALLSDLSEADRTSLASEEVFDRLITAGIDFYTHVDTSVSDRLAV